MSRKQAASAYTVAFEKISVFVHAKSRKSAEREALRRISAVDGVIAVDLKGIEEEWTDITQEIVG